MAAGASASGASTAPYVDIHETHTGAVVLAGDRAYKAKTPVLTDFLDFRTPEQRERACRRELELNDEWETAHPLDTTQALDCSIERAHDVWRQAAYLPTQRNQIEKG